MLIELKGQNEIVNLDRVSFITKSHKEGVFSIHFKSVIGRGNSETVGRSFTMSDPTIKQFVTWKFTTEHDRDFALSRLILQSGGITLAEL
jgi:hypothetical protein